MFLKLSLASVVMFLSLSVGAMVLVPAYNENYCPRMDDLIPVIRWSPNGEHVFETYRLMRIVEQWNQAFVSSGDQVVASYNGALCVGLMDDGAQPNAGALDKQFLLMGVALISMLERENLSDSQAKEVKEKFVLAHEYSHILQNLHGLMFDYRLPMLSTKIKEQHADCMATYMMGINDEIPTSQSENLEIFIAQLADAHIVGDHGTAEQRIEAHRKGKGLGIIQKLLLGNTLSSMSSSQLVRDCATAYRPTNL